LSLTALNNNGCVAAADFNKDGIEDAVVTNFGTDYASGAGKTITILYGKSGGGFSPVTLSTGGSNPSFVTVGDLNGDGYPDLVVTNENGQAAGTFSVFMNDGAGNLSLKGTYQTDSNNPDCIRLADVTGSGHLDAVVSSFGKDDGTGNNVVGQNITVFQGNGDGTFNPSPIATLAPQIQFIPTAVAVADFNGDGKMDIAATVPGVPADSSQPQPNGSVYIFQGTGAGGFSSSFLQYDSGGALPVNIQVADLNGDGKPDLVVANAGDPKTEFSNNSVGVLLNVSSGGSLNFGVTNSLTANCHGTFAVAVADFNLDGKQDIAAINYGSANPLNPTPFAFVSVYLGKGDGTFSVATPGTYDILANSAGGQYLAVGDYDGNGTPDLITAGAYNLVGLLLNTSTPSAGAATLAFSGVPSSTTAGSPFSFTLTAKNSSGNTATSYTGTVHFTSSDPAPMLPANYTFTASDAGVHTFTNGATLDTAGSQTITAKDTVTGTITGTTSGITVNAAAATHLTVSAPSSATAGNAFNVTVKALDAFNNTATSYTGTVHFTKSDTGAGSSVPADYTFVAGDNGAHTFTNGVTLVTAGNQTVTATDTVTSSITGNSNTIAVSPGAATHFTVSAPSSATAGTAFNLTVTALDAFNNTATGYTGTVHFTKSDSGAGSSVPANYTFVAGDNGVHTFANGVTLVTAGSQTVTATDTVTSSTTGTSGAITVSAAGASHFTVSAPSSATAGNAFNVTLTALDAFGNTATGYTGTAHFTKSDSGAGSSVPANYTFVAGDNGVHTFTNGVTLVSAGNQTVTATDTVTSSITGTSSAIAVSAAAATHFTVSAPNSAAPGSAFSVTVTALDAFNNTATGYTGTVHFTKSDSGTGSSVPANYTFASGDNGVHTFTNGVILVTPGNQTVTATDTVTSSIAGTSNSIAVSASAATHFTVSAPSSATAGDAFSITVTALDALNNTVTGYTGTVHFTKSDNGAGSSVPADYTFVAGDNGVHTFANGVTLVTAGNQTVTATDTVTSSITGTSNSIAVSTSAATHFTVSAPSSATAGNAFSVTVTALDALNQTVTGYTGTVHFTRSDNAAGSSVPADYTFVAGDSGVHTFSNGVTLVTVGNQTVTATDTVTSSITGTSNNIAVTAGAATHFTLSAPSTATAGIAISVTVTALDAFGNTAGSYRGTAHFTKSDNGSGSAVPADYTFTATDNGVHTTNAFTLVTAGNQSVSATDTATSSITGTSNTIVVGAAAATHLTVSAPSSATAGTAFSVTVTALDGFGNTASSYRGTVHFTRSDNAAGSAVPANYTFVAGDNGAHTFANGVTLVTAGNQTVTATDTVTGSITGTSNSIAVSPAAATHFTVSTPNSAIPGSAFSVTVTALDSFNNTATGYTGTVHFTKSDNGAGSSVPADYTFVAGDSGVHTFNNGVILVTPGNQTVTATDTGNSSITGTSNSITVAVPTATHFTVSAPNGVTAGNAFTVTVTALDAFGNTVTGYAGTIHFTRSDTGASSSVPPDYSFGPGDNGVHTFAGGVALVTAGNQTVTATDTANSSISGTSNSIAVSAAAATHFTVTAPSSTTAGNVFSVTVKALDAFGNTAGGYRGTVHFTKTDNGSGSIVPADYAFIAADNGVHTFTNGVTLVTAGNQRVTAKDSVSSSVAGTSNNIAVSAAAASQFTVTAPSSATAGNAFNVTVKVLDAFGNTATGYTGTVHFTGSDTGTGSSVPADYSFMAGDNGVHTFTSGVTLVTPGNQTVTATDTGDSSINGTSNNITNSPAAASHFTVNAPSSATAGNAFSVTVTALDPFGNTVTGYTGTVHFTKSDSGAGSSVPANYTFVAGDNGVHSFTNGVTLVTSGNQTITATDIATSSITGTSNSIADHPAAASHYTVNLPSSAVAGSACTMTVTALDAFGNMATGYTGTVHFTKSDSGAGSSVPADYSFVAGDNGAHTFANAVILVTAGNQTVTATDTGTSSVTGTSNSMAVSAAAASHFAVSAPGSATAGTAFSVTVTALDAFGNTVTGYAGTVHFTKSDNSASSSVPANYTFVAGDNGVHTFTNGVTLVTPGNQTVSATDTVTSITGTSNSITDSAAAASHFTVSAPTSATAGAALSVTVTALDAFGNTASSYRGTIHFTNSDTGTGALVPADYTFTAGDNGAHTFTGGVTLVTAANQTITATDTGAGSVTGATNGIAVHAAAANHYTVNAPSSATAGTAFSVTVTALDAFGNTAVAYRGTVHFTKSDSGTGSIVPANYTFTAGDNGVHTFTNGATLVTAGNRTVTATDAGNSSITGTAGNIAVSAAAASHFTVSAPSSATAGNAFSVTVTALDGFGNTAGGYRGIVHFTKTDSGTGSVVPANYTFIGGDNGVHTFTTGVTLVTPGNQTVTATDTTTSSITGTSNNIAASPGAASRFTVSTPGSAAAGNAFSVTVTALDLFGNTATGYTGTVRVTKSDIGTGSSVPANYTFVAGDNGVHTFVNGVILVTAGNQTVTATDNVISVSGISSGIAVSAAAASDFVVSAPGSATAGNAFSVTVTAQDAFGNRATGYAGTVHFTRSDNGAGSFEPADYTFVAGDNGVHTFTGGVTLVTAGDPTVTATDTVTSSITGTSNDIAVNAAAAASFSMSALPTTLMAGTAGGFTLTAEDAFGNVATSYTGTVHMSSNDPQALLPLNYTFTGADAGVHAFVFTLKTAATKSITVTDTSNAGLTDSGSLAITPAPASGFTLTGLPPSLTAGAAVSFTLTTHDAFGNVATDYHGTIHFASGDSQAMLPSDTTFLASDLGTRTFSATFKTAGTASVTAMDTGNPTVRGTGGSTVIAAAASRFTVTLNGPIAEDTVLGMTVAAFDAFNNPATAYQGVVHFTSSDPIATLPADYAFSAQDAGSHRFPGAVTLRTGGSQTVTATDTGTASVNGTSAGVAIPPEDAVTGSSQSFTGFDRLALTNLTIATFTHGNNSEAPGEFAASIDWGDGTTSKGTVTASGPGYQVTAGHTYADEGNFAIVVTVTDDAIATQLTGGSIVIKEVLPDSTRGTPNQRFVSEVYTDLLLRDVEAGGLAYWSSNLDLGMSRSVLVGLLAHSDEYYQTNVIKPAYLKYLGRAADQIGLTYWTQLMHNGLTDEQLEAGFIGSAEYYAKAGGTDKGWVDLLYSDLLGRLPDGTGEDYWIGALQNNTGRSTVALGFTASVERAKLRIQGSYLRFLGRPADDQGLNFWVNAFAHGSTNEDIVTEFLSTAEYYAFATR
jgi:hypothetical protein